ncbi:MAG: hypothetical protein HWN70_08190 [Desulfobacterales bacterium]|nr:hypothetical protein [Desulfobacterales bacterium]
MFHPTIIIKIAKLKTGDGDYFQAPALKEARPNTILGGPVDTRR